MLFTTGILIIIGVLALILSKKVSALTALIVVPVVGAYIAGLGSKAGDFAVTGIKTIAPVAAMFIFAILFFGILTDAGMFDPLIRRILKFAGRDPKRITVGAALLAMLVHLDGSGAVTFLIAIPAMLPLFERMQMDRRVLACVVALGAGTMNIVPWGGPTLRAASALNVDVTALYTPVMIPQLCGLLFVLGIAYHLGHKEAQRLSDLPMEFEETESTQTHPETDSFKRPHLFWFNVVVAFVTICLLISGVVAPAVIFMLSTVFVLVVNYPKLKDQRERIDAHAKEALLMASILLAAGVFTGIMKESGMINAIASEAIHWIPPGFGKHLPISLAVLSMPLSLFFDPDSFYFGVLPVVAHVGEGMGVSGASVGQAAILGQMTTGFPLSPLTATTFLLVGLTKVELADHQRFTFLYAFLTTLVMTIVCLLMGIFSL